MAERNDAAGGEHAQAQKAGLHPDRQAERGMESR